MGKTSLSASSDATRQRVLRAAEQLFGAKGVENVSLREMTTLAGVNLAAVNYHFGSKDALAEAVFEALSARVNTSRLANLQAVLEAADQQQKRPEISDILLTFLRPYLDPQVEGEGALLAQLILKHRLAPSEMTRRIVAKYFDPMAREYVDAYQLALPQIPREEFYWRYMFVAGAVLLAATDQERVNRVSSISHGAVDGANALSTVDALVRFLAGGMAAA